MIGFVQLYQKDNELVRLLSQFAYAKNVPFCHFMLDAIDSCMEGKPLIAKRWNGNTTESFETELPPIVDRITSINAPGARSVYGRERCEWLGKHTKILRQRSFHKDELMKAMMENGLGEYSIPSFYVDTFEQIRNLMSLFSPALIKPVLGTGGMLVEKIIQEGGCCYLQDQDGLHELNEASFECYREKVRKIFRSRILLQPFLDFSYDDNHVLDFRLFRQRGADGSWEDVATFGRIGSNPITSNFHTGGSMIEADMALKAIAGEKADALLDEIMMLGEKLPLLAEKYFGEDAFCIGFDVAVDKKSLRPYVMESNLTPGLRFIKYQYADHRVNYYKYLLSK